MIIKSILRVIFILNHKSWFYIAEVECSHGLCPECMKKLYPDESMDDL